MINKSTFCSSPWLHMRIAYSGRFVPCRWYNRNEATDLNNNACIQNMSLLTYFNSAPMIDLRNKMINGTSNAGCSSCKYEESFGKLSGRDKQLYRSNLNGKLAVEESPHWPMFEYSKINSGVAHCGPIDLQIDLDDTCNSACIMCHPTASSKLNLDYKKLAQIAPSLFKYQPRVRGWSSDSVLVKSLVDDIKTIQNVEYIHFLGGETLYVESFYTICEALIEAGIAKDIIIGTTTNGTIWSTRLEKLIPKFKAVHIGISIETVTSLNDYIRYPSEIADVTNVIGKFVALSKNTPTMHLELRFTPNIFSMLQLDSIFQFMIDNSLTAESCNILHSPSCMRIELLPPELVKLAIDRLHAVINKNNISRAPVSSDIRNNITVANVISNRIFEYVDFLSNMTQPMDVDSQRTDLVKFITSFESLRGNSILAVAPEFTHFLGQFGYK